MLTIEEFRVLPFHKKCDVVTFQSDYLCFRHKGAHKFFLYEAGGFFVEVQYSINEQEVTGFNAFDHVRWLQPYLDIISIEELWA